VNSFHQIPKILNRYKKWSLKIIRMVVQNVLMIKRLALEGDIASQTSKNSEEIVFNTVRSLCVARKVRNINVEREPVYYLCQMFPHSLLFIRRSIYCRLNYVHLF